MCTPTSYRDNSVQYLLLNIELTQLGSSKSFFKGSILVDVIKLFFEEI